MTDQKLHPEPGPGGQQALGLLAEVAIGEIDPGQRLSYPKYLNPSLNQHHLDEIARATALWLDHQDD